MHIASGLGNLTNLQTLRALEAHDGSIRHLGELRQLRSLRVLNVKGIYCGRINESLVEMQYLSYLHVSASDENEVLLLNVSLPNLKAKFERPTSGRGIGRVPSLPSCWGA